MLAKGKGFRRLTAVEVSDSGTDDEFQPLNNTKRSLSFPCCKLCWYGTVALVLLALCVGAALGGYLLYSIHLEIGSLRGEVDRLREQGSADHAALSLLQSRTSTELQQLQATVHKLDTVMAAVCRQNSTALDSIRQQLGDIGGTLEGSFASDINKLSYKVLNLSTTVFSIMESVKRAQNSSAACLTALGQDRRLWGDMRADVHLLKRANKTLTMGVGLVRSDLQALSHRWSTTSDSLNSSLLALQLAEASRGPCTNCCCCDHQPPSNLPGLPSTSLTPHTCQWAVTSTTTPLPPALVVPAVQPVQTSVPPEVATYSFAGTSANGAPGLWTNTPKATPPSHTPQPSMEMPSSNTPQLTMETPPSHTPQPTMEMPSSDTPQLTMETLPSHTPQPSMEMPSSDTPQPSMEMPSSDTPQLTMETPPSHTPQPTMEPSSDTPQLTMETLPSHTPQPSMEMPSSDTPQPSMEMPSSDTPQPSMEMPSSDTPQLTMETLPSHTPQPSMETSSSHTPQPSIKTPASGNMEQFRELLTVVESIRDSFNNTDVDSNGQLSQEEFRGLQLPAQASGVAKSEQFFSDFDLNNDTFVDMGELQRVLTRIHDRLTEPPSPSPSPSAL